MVTDTQCRKVPGQVCQGDAVPGSKEECSEVLEEKCITVNKPLCQAVEEEVCQNDEVAPSATAEKASN